jgi:hypothetical protein
VADLPAEVMIETEDPFRHAPLDDRDHRGEEGGESAYELGVRASSSRYFGDSRGLTDDIGDDRAAQRVVVS